jgi:hypothetical protein
MQTIRCLAIGISDAPPLNYLPGAVNGARAFAAWARARDAKVELLTDEKRPVGFTDARDALQRLLSGPGTISRLYIYFAGHGGSRGAAEDLWLLSHWRQDQRAISVHSLRRRLERYGVKQIAIVADACRSLPNNSECAELTADPILGLGPCDRNQTLVEFLWASEQFNETFMVPGADPDDDRCIFTGVLEEALSGAREDAFDPQRNAITSGSLKRFLDREVLARGAYYNVDCKPNITPGFISPEDVYLDAKPAVPPALKPWPASSVAVGQTGSSEITNRNGRRGWSTPATRIRRTRGGPVRHTAPIDQGAEDWKRAVELERRVEEMTRTFQAAYEAEEQRPTHYETNAGFSLAGDSARRVILTRGAQAIDDKDRRWWRIAPVEADDGTSVQWDFQTPLALLIELDSGNWTGAAALPGFITTLTVAHGGTESLICRRMHAPAGEGKATELAVSQLRAGSLTRDASFDLAASFREEKEQDPIRGMLAAYLYDTQADVESVRRTAHSLAYSGISIPYDIALLGRVPCRRDPNGRIVARIPATKDRVPKSREEETRPWTYSATGEIHAPVAGAFPWLRQGWTLLDPGGDDPALVSEELAALGEFLLPHTFTTLRPEGGQRLSTYLESL